jgi:hypothetical protein
LTYSQFPIPPYKVPFPPLESHRRDHSAYRYRRLLPLRLDRPDILDPLDRVAGLHHPVRRLSHQMRVPPEMVVREPEIERVDLFELGDVGVGKGDLQGLDVILEVFDLTPAD